MTRKQLLRFISIRNKSGFANNLQFGLDASAAGFELAEIAESVRKVGHNHYEWETPHGVLVEKDSRLSLREDPNARIDKSGLTGL